MEDILFTLARKVTRGHLLKIWMTMKHSRKDGCITENLYLVSSSRHPILSQMNLKNQKQWMSSSLKIVLNICGFTSTEIIIEFKAVTNEKAMRLTESSQNSSSILVPKASYGL